MHLSSP